MDPLGLVIVVVARSAATQDRDGALYVFWRVRAWLTRLALVWADGGYAGALVGWVATFCQFVL